MVNAIYIKASWCNPCKVQLPKFVSECEALGIPFKVYDADDNEKEIEAYGVRNVPFVIVENEGVVVARGKAEDMTPMLHEFVQSNEKK